MSQELFSDEETKILANSIASSAHRYSALDSTEDLSEKTTRDVTNVQEFQVSHEKDNNDGSQLETNHIPRFEKYCKTFALSCLMFGMGTMHAIIGPTLLDLAYGLSVTLSQVSLVFVGQATGFIIGVIIGGVTCDYVDHWLLLLVVLIGAASLTMAVPFWPTLATLVIASLFRGACMRALELVVNIALLDLWGKESSSPMQQLHFTVAVGCGVVPLLVKPFAGKEIHRSKRSPTNTRQITRVTTNPLGSLNNLSASVSQSVIPGNLSHKMTRHYRRNCRMRKRSESTISESASYQLESFCWHSTSVSYWLTTAIWSHLQLYPTLK
ncbi:sodium-dependent glucose transporter 1-like [Convolutriloba macropyga]|uniref:sodium-dependent glucose transporter 1-like n=1 Tax=Convolutriloba macropyga TaxID=536237 RepID=UPI003F52402E